MTEIVTRNEDAAWLLAYVSRGVAWRLGAILFTFTALLGAHRAAPAVATLVGATFVGAIGVLLGGLLEWCVRGVVWLRVRWPWMRTFLYWEVERATPDWFAPTHRLRCHFIRWGYSVEPGVLWLAPARARFVPDRWRGLRSVRFEDAVTVSVAATSWVRRWLMPWPEKVLCLRGASRSRQFLVAGLPDTADQVRGAMG